MQTNATLQHQTDDLKTMLALGALMGRFLNLAELAVALAEGHPQTAHKTRL